MAMERAEKQGLAVAAIGHVALFVVLSLGLFSARIPKPPVADTMDVTIADQVGLRSAATEASTEAPKASEAPERGKPEESAPAAPPPAATPAPVPPKPTPVPPKPKPAPPKPEPKPVPKPEPKPVPKPEKPKPEKAKPDKAKPDKAKPDKVKPDKATPEKSDARATPNKAAPAKATTSSKRAGLSSDLLKDLKDPGTGKGGKGKADAAPKGSRLGKDFLKGIGSDAKGTSDKPRAAAVSARSMAGLAAQIAAQVKPCYSPPAGGADVGSIVTTLRLRFRPDGSVANPPTVVDQAGVGGSNAAYARQMGDAAKRAVLRCAPLKLPADLYEGGWEDIEFVFRPEAMG